MYYGAISVTVLSFVPLMFGIQHIFNIIYAAHNKRYFNAYATLNLIDAAIFVVFFTNIMNTLAGNLIGTWNEQLITEVRA